MLHSFTIYAFDRKYKYMRSTWVLTWSYICYEEFWEKCLNVYSRLSFLWTNSFATLGKFMLSRIFLWTCTNIRACSRLFPIVDLRYVLKRFKSEKMPSPSIFLACESKISLTIFPASISWHILQFFNNGAHDNCAIIVKCHYCAINLAITLTVMLIYWCQCPRC